MGRSAGPGGSVTVGARPRRGRRAGRSAIHRTNQLRSISGRATAVSTSAGREGSSGTSQKPAPARARAASSIRRWVSRGDGFGTPPNWGRRQAAQGSRPCPAPRLGVFACPTPLFVSREAAKTRSRRGMPDQVRHDGGGISPSAHPCRPSATSRPRPRASTAA